jgi:hypothetical protein
MLPNSRQRRKFGYWIALGVYASYSFLILGHWTWDWYSHHGLKKWLLGLWWIGLAPEMMIPSFPSSLSLNAVLFMLPDSLFSLQSGYEIWWMIFYWAWFTAVGYFQWFIAVPFLWSKIRKLRTKK